MPESLSNLVDTLAVVFSSYNFLMVLYVFYIRLHVLVDFPISDFLAETLKANKI